MKLKCEMDKRRVPQAPSHPFDASFVIHMLVTMDDKEAQRVREFQEAYKQEFGEELTTGEASAMLTQLVQFHLHISRPLPQDIPANGDDVVQS